MAKVQSAIRAAAILSVAGCLAAVVDARSAAAALMVRALTSADGGASFTQLGSTTDGQAGDLNPVAGGLAAFYSGSGFNMIMPTSTGSPAVPYPALNVTFNINGTVSAATILRIEYTQTDVPNSAGTYPFRSGFSITSLLGISSVSLSSFGDPDNLAYSTSVPLANVVLSTTDGQNFVNSLTPSTTSPNFSETLRVDIPFAAGTSGALVGSMSVTAVPISEPMTIALFGAGLLGLAAIRRIHA